MGCGSWGFFCIIMNKTVFLVDGFNLYASTIDIMKDYNGLNCKWLNIPSLCNSYLSSIGNHTVIENIFYFTAIPYYLLNINPHRVQRHKLYIEALKSQGVKIIEGRFKDKEKLCPNCHTIVDFKEEKETDVALASKLFEIFATTTINTIALISGDSDLAPALKTVKTVIPQSNIVVLMPYKRWANELKKIADIEIDINPKKYLKHQFPDVITLKNGTKIIKPSEW